MGSGLTGFCAGLWPALFSIYCPLIIKNHGIHASFHYNALIVTCTSIPALLFLTDPSDVPLLDEGAATGAKPGVGEEDTIVSVDGPNEAVSRNETVGAEGHSKFMDDELVGRNTHTPHFSFPMADLTYGM